MSAFHDAAATLGAGEFVRFHTPEDGSGYGVAIGPEVANPSSPYYSQYPASTHVWYKGFDFQSRIHYDLERKRFHHRGGLHSEAEPAIPNSLVYLTITHAVYDIGDDTFTKIPFSASQQAVYNGVNAHGYNLQAVIGGSREFLDLGANGTQIRTFNIDKDNPVDIGATAADYPSPTGGGSSRGFIEHFPERKSVIFLHSGSGNIYEKFIKPGTSWNLVASLSSAINFGYDGIAAIYNPLHKCMLIGGKAADYNIQMPVFKVYWVDGSVTNVAAFPANTSAYFADSALIECDPVSGKFVLFSSTLDLTAYRVYEYDPTNDGAGWVRRTDVEANIPVPLGATGGGNYFLFDVLVGSAWDLGVFMFWSPFGTYLYKHSANTWAENGGPPWDVYKNMIPGVCEYQEFKDQSELTYNFGGNNTLKAACESVVGTTLTDYGSAGNTRPVAYPWGPTYAVPHIYQELDGRKRLKINMPSKNSEAPGTFFWQFSGGPYAWPATDNTNVYWFQFKYEGSPELWNNFWRKCYRNSQGGGLLVCSAGSTTVQCQSGAGPVGGLTNAVVGKKITISNQGNGNFVEAEYTIQSLTNESTMVLNTSPAPQADANGGFYNIEGTVTTPVSIDGIKLVDQYGAGWVILNGRLSGQPFNLGNKPQGYTQSGGAWQLPENTTVPFVTDGEQVITCRMEVLAPGTVGNRCEIWIGNPATGQVQKSHDSLLGFQDSGFTRMEILPHATFADACYVHSEAFVYYSECIVSSAPLPFLGASPSSIAAPSLTSISPASANPGTTASLTLTGANFSVGYQGGNAQVILQSPLTLSGAPVIVNDTRIDCNVIIPLAAGAGQKSIRVQTDGGFSSTRYLTINDISGTLLGYQTPGATSTFISGNYIVACGPFTALSSGTAIKMHAYLPADLDITLGYYTAAGSLVACTAGGVFTGSAGLKNRPIQNGTIVEGTQYYLCIWAGAVINPIHADTLAGRGKFAAATYSPGNMPSTFPASPTVLNSDFIIYIEYVDDNNSGGNLPRYVGFLYH